MKNVADESYELLLIGSDEKFDFSAWMDLGKAALLQTMLFNRRRPGECSRTELQQYLRKQKISESDRKHMTVLEKVFAEKIEVFETIGKRDRTLTILLLPQHTRYIDLLISKRNAAGISSKNKFLFANQSTRSFISASEAILQFSKRCGAEHPETFTGTRLRKQIATLSQLLVMDDNEIHQLADFMGHDVSVHLKHYRTPETWTQVTKLSKFLMCVGNVDPKRYKGKKNKRSGVAGRCRGARKRIRRKRR